MVKNIRHKYCIKITPSFKYCMIAISRWHMNIPEMVELLKSKVNK